MATGNHTLHSVEQRFAPNRMWLPMPADGVGARTDPIQASTEVFLLLRYFSASRSSSMPISDFPTAPNEDGPTPVPDSDRMELEVRDFGPIGRASVDLRPLMVFVGPSNTGKSWLATLIYALHRHFRRSVWGQERAAHRLFPILRGRALELLDGDVVWEMINWTNRLHGDLREWPKERRFVLPGPVADILRFALEAGDDELEEEMMRCFGVAKLRQLVREGSTNGSSVLLRRHTSEEPQPLEHRLEITTAQLNFAVQVGHSEEVRLPRRVSASVMRDLLNQDAGVRSDDTDLWAILVLSQLAGVLRSFAVDPLHQRAHYLPSGRNGLLHSQTALLRNLVRHAGAGRRRSADAPYLGGVPADFLDGLVQLGDPALRGSGNLEGIARWMEETVLDGSLRVDSEGGVPRIAFRPHGWKHELALINASSMASDIGPMVLYLRYLVDPGDVLIIEEPESSLHPAKQVALFRALAELACAGVRVLITTHSEWILEELANVVRRSLLPAEDHDPSRATLLSSSQIGAWLFRPSDADTGAEVREIKLDDSGLYPTGFQEVATALHNDWAEITSRLENGR